MRFQTLVERVVEDQAVKSAIADLLEKKKNGQELDHGPRIPALNGFIEEELARLSAENAKPSLSSDISRLDELFHI